MFLKYPPMSEMQHDLLNMSKLIVASILLLAVTITAGDRCPIGGPQICARSIYGSYRSFYNINSLIYENTRGFIGPQWAPVSLGSCENPWSLTGCSRRLPVCASDLRNGRLRTFRNLCSVIRANSYGPEGPIWAPVSCGICREPYLSRLA